MHKFLIELKRQIKRKLRTPFKDKNLKMLIVHCSHHKAGTVWLINVLKAVSRHYGLRVQISNRILPIDDLKPLTDIYIQNHSLVDALILPPFKGSHLIRDPRDIIVSGYFYHLWTKEWWVHVPRKGSFQFPENWPYFSIEEFGNLSYQQYLKSLDQEEGILVELRRAAGYNIKHMVDWDYSNPNFIEVKYENLMKDWRSEFNSIFNHYEFKQEAIDISLKLTDKLRFENIAKRKIGEVKEKSHLRSGQPGQWKEYFTDSHKARFKDLLGDALIKLGYESNNDW
jgi:hypothetical protein